MEGVHFVAGPWFTVRKHLSGFQKLGDVWLSDGKKDQRGHIELKVAFAPTPNAPH